MELLDSQCQNFNHFEQRQRYSAMNNSVFPAQVYQTSPKSSVHAFDFRDVSRHLINMQKREIGVLRGLGTRLQVYARGKSMGYIYIYIYIYAMGAIEFFVGTRFQS